MKIELIKEPSTTDVFEARWCTYIDGKFISGSMEFTEEKGIEKYEMIKKNFSKQAIKKTIIKTEEI